jgi:hypothetical protein
VNRVCIRNPIDSHVENEQEVKENGEYSYYLDTQNSVNADGGGSIIDEDEKINKDTHKLETYKLLCEM